MRRFQPFARSGNIGRVANEPPPLIIPKKSEGQERSNPDFPSTYRWVAAALGQLGRLEDAKAALEKAIAVAPVSFDAFVRRRVPWHRPEDHAHMLEGLRKAGWRET